MNRIAKTTIFMIMAVLLVGVTVVLALDNFDPTDTWNVTPILKIFPSDRACPAGSTLVGDQFQSVSAGDMGGTASAIYTIDGKPVTVKITYYPDNSFDFEIVGGMTPQMFVKGSNYLLYQYDPPVTGATNTGMVSYDTGLHDGVNPNNDQEYQEISHLDFCLVPKGDPLEATKTAAGSYERTVTWELTKSVDPGSHTGYAGETAGSSTWTVVATKNDSGPFNFKVEGKITIYNPNNYAVPFSVTDSLHDGTTAAVVCPVTGDNTGTVPANDTVVCDYTAYPTDASATLNTAVVASGEPLVDGDTATAPVSFTEKLTGYDEGTLSDPRFEYSELISASKTKTFIETFVCPANASLYTNGEYKFTETNWAYLNDNIDLSASAKVDVTCYLEPLDPSKTAAGSYDRTVTWELAKSVDPASHKGFIGQAAGSSTWTVVATKTEIPSNYKVKGKITIDNPAAIPQSFTASDVLDDGTSADVDCDPVAEGNQAYGTVPAGGTVVCDYTAYPVDDSATLNTATITATGNPAQTATAAVSFDENLIGYDSGTLSDPRFGYSELISDSKTKTFPETFNCPTDVSLYEDGVYQFTEINWAYLNGNIGLEKSASVTVTCYAPVLAKDAHASYDERHIWDIEKFVDPETQNGYPGDELSWEWKVTLSESYVEEKFAVWGDIDVTNPAGSPGNMTVSLVDQLNDGTFATVDCGGGATSLTVAPGKTETCTYTAEPTGRTATENKATGTFNSVEFVATYPVNFVKTVINGSATVTDLQIGLNETVTAGLGPWEWTASDKHTCSVAAGDYGADGTYSGTLDNTAYVNASDGQSDQSSASTTYTCEAGFMDLLKLTGGVVNPLKEWHFVLYEGPHGFDGIMVGSPSSTLDDADGVLEFGNPALRLDTTYTVCELGSPSGWFSNWWVDVDGDGIYEMAVDPYNPNADDPDPEDLGNRCVDFGAGTNIPVKVGTTIHFKVDNNYPGGAPRTPGYWKNWNRCTGGRQQYVADANGGWEEGFWLVEDIILPPGPGITWDDILTDEFSFPIDSCELAVSILDSRDFKTGKKMASDPAYQLARNLLAAQLNLAAGACRTPEVEQAVIDAETLLDEIDFDAAGVGISKKDKKLAADARMLAAYLDQYNNGMFCGGGSD